MAVLPTPVLAVAAALLFLFILSCSFLVVQAGLWLRTLRLTRVRVIEEEEAFDDAFTEATPPQQSLNDFVRNHLGDTDGLDLV